MKYEVTVSWKADPVPDPAATAVVMQERMAPWRAGPVTSSVASDDGLWSTTVYVEEEHLRQAVATALVVVTSTARDHTAGAMTDVEAVEIHAALTQYRARGTSWQDVPRAVCGDGRGPDR